MLNNLTFPKYLSIQTTSLCNASCIFCPYEEIKNLFHKKIMDMALYKKVIDECSGYKNIERIILYMNNEPLTDPYLIERINYAKGKVPWASVHILTNGLLLTDEMTEKLINSKLDWIGISFHGIRKETVERAMSMSFKVAFKRINNFIEKAKEKKDVKEYVMITFLRHKYLSLDEKEEAMNFWQGKGIERISYFDGPISRAGNVKDLPKVYHKERIVGCNSIWADEMLHIVEDGKVVLCCMDWGREVILGDLNKESIYEVWNGKRKDTWQMIYGKKDMPAEFLCRRCEEAKLEITAKKENEDLFLVMTPPWETKMPPLGVAYLISFLNSKGFKVKVVDLNVKLFNDCADDRKYFWEIATINSFTSSELARKFVKEFNKELNDFIEMICNSPTKLIGFSTTIASLGIAVYLARQIKLRDPSKIIILGGPGCFWNTYDIDPERLIDVLAIGEGELPLLEIVRRFKDKNSLSNLFGIQGTILCVDKKYHTFLPPSPVKKIDELPFPKFLEFDLDDYNRDSGYRPLPLLMSRGCINKCSFCIDHKMNYPFRFRDPHKVLDEIKFHIRQYGREDFEFNDLLCNGNLIQLEKICDLIIEENLKVRWTSYATIREGMTLELCKKMKRAGCRYICYGLESGSDVVLRKMNKKYNSQLAEEVIRNTHRAGIETAVNIIIGHPGESEEEFKNTCEFMRRNKDYIDQVTNVSTCFLMPEADLMNNLDNYGVYFKKSLKDRINSILREKEFYPNYREFYTHPDNTPYDRARWLRRFLMLLYKLGTHYVIVNYVKEHDRNLDRFIERTNAYTFKYKYFKLDVSQKGQCKLYFKNTELTADVGMNSSFFVDGKWIDSSSAQWEVKKFRNFLDINIKWPGIPIAQKWVIQFRGKYVDWKVKICFHDRLRIFQQKIGVTLLSKYNKYTLNGSTSRFPDVFTRNWDEILFSEVPQIGLTADAVLPPLVLEQAFKEEVFLQLQNSPFSIRARMVNFCFLRNNHPEGYNNEGYRFNKGDILEGRIRIYLRF